MKEEEVVETNYHQKTLDTYERLLDVLNKIINLSFLNFDNEEHKKFQDKMIRYRQAIANELTNYEQEYDSSEKKITMAYREYNNVKKKEKYFQDLLMYIETMFSFSYQLARLVGLHKWLYPKPKQPSVLRMLRMLRSNSSAFFLPVTTSSGSIPDPSSNSSPSSSPSSGSESAV